MIAFDDSVSIRWLFLFAHPDDELALAGWLSHLQNRAVPFRIVYLSRTQVRMQEAQSALDGLGIPLDEVFFESFPDGHFCERIAELTRAVRAHIDAFAPDRVVACAFEQGHLDHESVRFAVSRCWSGTTLEFPEYWPYSPWVVGMNRFSDSQGETRALDVYMLQKKQKAFDCYRSQRVRKLHAALTRWAKLARKSVVPGEVEAMRVAMNAPNFRQPSHRGLTRVYVTQHPKWRTWLRALENTEVPQQGTTE